MFYREPQPTLNDREYLEHQRELQEEWECKVEAITNDIRDVVYHKGYDDKMVYEALFEVLNEYRPKTKNQLGRGE